MANNGKQNVPLPSLPLPSLATSHLTLDTIDTDTTHPAWHLYILTIKYNKAKIVFKYSQIFIEYKIEELGIYDY
ncbi:MAG TPA: hypothetical protein VFC98_01525 [Clostridia bacterium]|nr:hypothetical protein [Clostridia bacterium]